jgi:hypothetical protein
MARDRYAESEPVEIHAAIALLSQRFVATTLAIADEIGVKRKADGTLHPRIRWRLESRLRNAGYVQDDYGVWSPEVKP